MSGVNKMDGINPDQTEFDKKIFLIVCLRYSGILNLQFLLLGPFYSSWDFLVLSLPRFGDLDFLDWTWI